jgi:hypothetical protein
MTARQITGWAIIALPFAGIFIFGALVVGLLEIVGIFVGVAALVALIRVGVEMTV